MKNLLLFIATILLYCGNVSAQSSTQNFTYSTTTDSSIRVYQSPTQGHLRADTHDVIFNRNVQSFDATIYTTDGKQVHSEKLEATSMITLNTQHLPKASYILHLRTNDGQVLIGEFDKF